MLAGGAQAGHKPEDSIFPRELIHFVQSSSAPRSNLFRKQCAGLSATALARDALEPVTEPTLYKLVGRPSSRKGSR